MRAAPLRSRSCILDGEAVACGDGGIALFERIRYRRHDASVFLYAFEESEGPVVFEHVSDGRRPRGITGDSRTVSPESRRLPGQKKTPAAGAASARLREPRGSIPPGLAPSRGPQ